jgi:hypothetical protein
MFPLLCIGIITDFGQLSGGSSSCVIQESEESDYELFTCMFEQL